MRTFSISPEAGFQPGVVHPAAAAHCFRDRGPALIGAIAIATLSPIESIARPKNATPYARGALTTINGRVPRLGVSPERQRIHLSLFRETRAGVHLTNCPPNR